MISLGKVYFQQLAGMPVIVILNIFQNRLMLSTVRLQDYIPNDYCRYQFRLRTECYPLEELFIECRYLAIWT